MTTLRKFFSARLFLVYTCIFLRGERGKRDKWRNDAIAQKKSGAESLRYGAEKFALLGQSGAKFALTSGAEQDKWRKDAIAQKKKSDFLR